MLSKKKKKKKKKKNGSVEKNLKRNEKADSVDRDEFIHLELSELFISVNTY